MRRRTFLGAAAALALGTSHAQRPGIMTRRIPSSGEALPAIGLGTWQVFDVGAGAAERAPLREVLAQFAKAGGKMIDSSPMYGQAEAVAGDLAAELGLRDRLFLATKVWTSGREEGLRQIETSYRRLRVEVMDLLQVHNLVDTATHLKTMQDLKAKGRLRYLGLTHYTASAHADLEAWLTKAKVDFLQVNYSLAEPEAERRLLPLARERGVAVIANRPFAEGAMFRRVKGKPVPPWAAEFGAATWAQFFLKWIVGHPAVTCTIPGTGKPEHIADNVAAGFGPLPDEAMRRKMAAHFAQL